MAPGVPVTPIEPHQSYVDPSLIHSVQPHRPPRTHNWIMKTQLPDDFDEQQRLAEAYQADQEVRK